MPRKTKPKKKARTPKPQPPAQPGGDGAPSPVELSDKQKAFVEHYLQTWNAAEAARRAGYSAHTARFIGSENLTKPNIQEAIKARVAEIRASADEVLLRLADHARGSIGDFLDEQNEFDLDNARENGKLHLIRKLKRTTRTDDRGTTNTIEVELYDAQAATVQLGRTWGLFLEKIAPVDPTGKKPYAPPLNVDDLSDDQARKYLARLGVVAAQVAGQGTG